MRMPIKAKASRRRALLGLPLLGACSSLAPAAVDATPFRNAQTGQVIAGCGPMQGVTGPLEKARQARISAYRSKGWKPRTGEMAQTL